MPCYINLAGRAASLGHKWPSTTLAGPYLGVQPAKLAWAEGPGIRGLALKGHPDKGKGALPPVPLIHIYYEVLLRSTEYFGTPIRVHIERNRRPDPSETGPSGPAKGLGTWGQSPEGAAPRCGFKCNTP